MDAHIVETKSSKLQLFGCIIITKRNYKKIPIIVFKMSDHLALDLDEHVICCVKNALTPSFRCKVAQILLF